MNNTIYKYPLDTKDTNILELPKGAQILTVQTQNNIPCIWALVNDKETEKESRFINTFGTGHPIDSSPRKYIGTYQLHNGALVFHVFEETVLW